MKIWGAGGGGHFLANAAMFAAIPGNPIAYWVSVKLLSAFENGVALGEIAAPRQGLATGDNERFLRLWYEVNVDNAYFTATDSIQAMYTGKKWFPCNKGGTYRKWFGNNNYVVNWQCDGAEMKNFSGSVIRNVSYYFQEGGTWSTIANDFSMRYSPKGFMFESKGSVCFVNENNLLNYVIGFLNCKIVNQLLLVLSPTLDYHEGPLSKIPIIKNHVKETNIDTIVSDNISLSKQDWDAFETSWDFKRHPLT